MPTFIPQITSADLAGWRGLSYCDLCVEILKLWIPPETIPWTDLVELAQASFSKFDLAETVSLERLDDDLCVLELFSGPTLAFKDLGMSVLCAVLQYLVKKDGSSLNLLVGTSGDTGPSALEAVRGMSNLNCVVLYPLERVSSVQEGQMLRAGATSPNCFVIGVEGTSDELDEPCEGILKDAPFKARHRIGTVNSVNIVRMIVQAVHFVYAYLRLVTAETSPSSSLPSSSSSSSSTQPMKVTFSVPSGAAGHVTAGLLAKFMGLPIEALLVATNANDVLHSMITSGRLAKTDAVKTLSNAMDIQVPYNYERLLYLLSGGDHEAVAGWVKAVGSGETVQLPASIRDAMTLHGLVSCSVTDEQVLETIRTQHAAEKSYLLDPHTAVGVTAARRLLLSETIAAADEASTSLLGRTAVVCMGCAHPAKFPETVAQALGLSFDAAVDLLAARYHDKSNVLAAIEIVKNRNAAGNRSASLSECSQVQDGDTLKHGLHAAFRRANRGDWEPQLREITAHVASSSDVRRGARTLDAPAAR